MLGIYLRSVDKESHTWIAGGSWTLMKAITCTLMKELYCNWTNNLMPQTVSQNQRK